MASHYQIHALGKVGGIPLPDPLGKVGGIPLPDPLGKAGGIPLPDPLGKVGGIPLPDPPDPLAKTVRAMIEALGSERADVGTTAVAE